MELFGEWEKSTGHHPPALVRKLGWELRMAYFRAMGTPDLSERVRRNGPCGGDLDQIRRWDSVAAEFLRILGDEDAIRDLEVRELLELAGIPA